MRSASYVHYLPSRDQLSDGNGSPRASGTLPPNDSVHPRSISRTPNLLHTLHLSNPSSQQPPCTSHPSPLTPRLDMYPPRQSIDSLYSTYNDSLFSLATQCGHSQAPWMPRGYESRRQPYDPSHHANYYRTPRDLDDHQKRNSLPPHAFQQRNSYYFLSLPDVRGVPRASSADVERDRQARACGQPPPPSASYGLRLDYTSQQSTVPFSYDHMPHGIRRIEEDRHQCDPKTSVEPAKPQSLRPKPHVLYSRLDKLVRLDKRRATDHISFDDVLELYSQEASLQDKVCEKHRGRSERGDIKFRVIGAPLRDALVHASSMVTIGEYQHDIPTVVVACIEELSRTGIYQQGLFRTLPSRDRYIQLIDIYDSSTDYGAKFSMHKQTMPDICAVLSTFISSLPHPLLDPRLYGGFWHWCVKPSVKREEARRSQQDAEEDDKRTKGELPPTLPMPVKQQQQQRLQQTRDDLNLGNDDDIECHQILVAQLILRFLPIGHLSLLIYLCGFFTQLPLCPENGIHFEDIARIYGSKILGGTTKVSSQKMMVWLLSRWYKISEGLLTDACGVPQSSTTAQEELPNNEDIGGTSPLLQTCGARRSRSSDSDRSSYSSSSPHDQVESTRHRKKRSIESTPESDDEAPPRSGRPSRRHRLGCRDSVYAENQKQTQTSMGDLSGVFSMAFAKARVDPNPSSDSTFSEHTSRDTPDRLVLETRLGIAHLGNELRRNKTFEANDEAHLLPEKAEQLDKTSWHNHNPSAPECKGLVAAAG